MIQLLFLPLLALAGAVAISTPRRRAAAVPGSLAARFVGLTAALRRPWIAYAAIYALGACGLLHAGLVDSGALLQRPMPEWLRHAAIVPIIETYRAVPPPWLSPSMEMLAIVESAVVATLWFATDAVRDRRRLAIVAAATFAVDCTVFATLRGVASADMLAYIGDARLGSACYSRPTTFGGPFSLVSAFWGAPMIPCAYGPAWLALVHGLVGPMPSIGAAVGALRVLAIAALLACVEACRRLAVPRRCLYALFLDPSIFAQFVGDGHNDLEMIALVLWARVFALGGRTRLAVLLAGVAAGGKAVVLVIAPLAFVRMADVRHRRAASAASVVLGLGISAAWGGRSYITAAVSTGKIYASGIPAFGRPILDGAIVLTVYAVAAAVWTGRTSVNAAFGFAACGAFTHPWYLAWGLPYALLVPESALGYIAALPVLTFLVSSSYAPTVFSAPLALLMTGIAWSMLRKTLWRDSNPRARDRTSGGA